MDTEPVNLSLSPLYVQPNNYGAKDREGNSYFVTDIDVGYNKQLMFEAISRKPTSRFTLFGIGVAANYLVYEDGFPWESKTTEDMRYRTREILCGLHHLHYDLHTCHQNIDFESKASLVVSRSSGSGKLAGMIGCEECSKKPKKNELCRSHVREKDVIDLVNYIYREMGAYIDREFDYFLGDIKSLVRLISHPAEVIYQHPIWIAHPTNKLVSRSMLNGHLRAVIDLAWNDPRLANRIHDYFTTYASYVKQWRSFVDLRPILKRIYDYRGTESYPESSNLKIEVKHMARFARNVYEHCEASDYPVLERHLEQMMPHFRTFMFRLMVEFDNFTHWNLEKIT